jgi:hypothetical protein
VQLALAADEMRPRALRGGSAVGGWRNDAPPGSATLRSKYSNHGLGST